MTLYQIINTLKGIALTQPNVKSATDGSVYDVMNTNPSVKYDVVHFSQTSHQSTEEWDYYGFNIFYISRLEDSLEDNRLQIQSIGKEVLDNIIRTFTENWSIPYPVSITYIPFTQKFADLTAGVYCTLRLDVPKDIICADDYLAEVVPGSGIKLQDMTVTITENGLRVFTPDAEYDGIGEIRIVTDVPQYQAVLQDKEVEYTENGSYTVRPDSNYDGLSSVSVDVDVPDRYDEGYGDGKEDGENEQKAKLTVTSFTENDTYTRADGWSAITVNVPQGQGYEEGYEDGYEDGYRDGSNVCSGLIISSLTLVVDSIIENSGVATSIFSPSTAYTDLHYSTSDPTVAVIDEIDGVITVISNGTVTICVTDRITGLKSCQTVAARKSEYAGPFEVIYDVTSTTNPTQILESYGRAAIYFDYFTYDGVDYPITRDTTGFTFPTIGRHTVSYHLISPTVGITFWGCDRLVEAHIPSYVTTFDGTFAKTSLSAVTLNEGLVRVRDAFKETDLISVVLPDSLLSIDESSFAECHSLVNITIGDGVDFVGDNAFLGCENLTGITFPASLGMPASPQPRIGQYAFSGCTGLQHLTFLSETPAFLVGVDNSLGSTAYAFPIYVPNQSVSVYKEQWQYYKDRITAIIP